MNNRASPLSIATFASLLGIGSLCRPNFEFRFNESTGLRRRKYHKRGNGTDQKPYRKQRSDFELGAIAAQRSAIAENASRPGNRKVTTNIKKIRRQLREQTA